MKLIFLGDSLTWGGYGGNFVNEVKTRLPEHDIINAGVGGNTVVNLLRRLEDDVLDHDPDGVFVMVGGNDSISYTQPATRPYYKKSQKIPGGVVTPEEYAHTYRELLTRLQLAHIETWVGLSATEYNPSVVQAKKQYNDLTSDIARSMNIPVLDFMPYFMPEQITDRPAINLEYINRIGVRSQSGWNDYETEQREQGYKFTFDGLHLTPESARQMATLIVGFLNL